MNVDKLIKQLSQTATNKLLVREFSSLGIDISNELKLPPGEFNAYIERPENGFSLVFTDEAMFLGKGNQPIGQGELYFSGIFLYSKGKDGYKQYPHNIPMGLSFEKKREALISLLGDPSWSRKRPDSSIVADRWDSSADYRIHITYSKSKHTPSLISLGIANKKS